MTASRAKFFVGLILAKCSLAICSMALPLLAQASFDSGRQSVDQLAIERLSGGTCSAVTRATDCSKFGSCCVHIDDQDPRLKGNPDAVLVMQLDANDNQRVTQTVESCKENEECSTIANLPPVQLNDSGRIVDSPIAVAPPAAPEPTLQEPGDDRPQPSDRSNQTAAAPLSCQEAAAAAVDACGNSRTSDWQSAQSKMRELSAMMNQSSQMAGTSSSSWCSKATGLAQSVNVALLGSKAYCMPAVETCTSACAQPGSSSNSVPQPCRGPSQNLNGIMNDIQGLAQTAQSAATCKIDFSNFGMAAYCRENPNLSMCRGLQTNNGRVDCSRPENAQNTVCLCSNPANAGLPVCSVSGKLGNSAGGSVGLDGAAGGGAGGAGSNAGGPPGLAGLNLDGSDEESGPAAPGTPGGTATFAPGGSGAGMGSGGKSGRKAGNNTGAPGSSGFDPAIGSGVLGNASRGGGSAGRGGGWVTNSNNPQASGTRGNGSSPSQDPANALLELKKFMPGAERDPRRGLANVTGPDGLTGPGSDLFKKVSAAYSRWGSNLRP